MATNSLTSSVEWKDQVLKQPLINSRGNIYLETNEGYPASTNDNGKNLVYGVNGNDGTSRPSVKIDGSVYYLDHQSFDISTNTYTVADTGEKIKQSVNIVGNYKDKYEIKYEIENTSGQEKEIGFLFHMDTDIGRDDYAGFKVNNMTYGSTESSVEFTNVPQKFNVYNDTGSGNDELMAEGIIKDTTITYGDGNTYTYDILTEPDKFGIGMYSSINNWDWVPSGNISDSGYGVWWNPRPVGNGSSFNVNVFYGLTVPPTIPDPPNTPAPSTPPDRPDTECHNIVIQCGANKGDLFLINLTDAQTNALNISNVSVITENEAQQAINLLDNAIRIVSTERSKWGAYQKALEHIQSNVSNSNVNQTSAESRIRDVDMALEMTELTKRNILNQSAQANQLPQGILQLLK